MRDDSYLESEVEVETTPSKWRGHAVTGIGALLSVAILTGVVIWSYRLGVRDAAEIPVIRAELGATKERPEEPGGLEVDYQGRAVYGVLSGDGSEAGATAYAEAPETLAPEDVAPLEQAPTPSPRPTSLETAVTPEAPTSAPSPVPVANEAQANAPAVASSSATTSASDEETTLSASIDAALQTEAEETALGDNGLAPAIAPVARPRPTRVAVSQPQAPAAAPEPRAAALASRIQIQLGAFVTQEIAEAQWAAIKSRNGDLLAGRGRVITPVLSGGRRLFRLRAGPFSDVTEASTLCRGLKARNEACIVARKEN